MNIGALIAGFPGSWLAELGLAPWELTEGAPRIVEEHLDALDAAYDRSGTIAVHRSATIEAGATVKGPAIIGPGCFVAAGAYLRGGCWLAANCTIGPGAEAKSSFLFPGATLAHLNFVGDSLLGSSVNLEAGAIVANHRNETPGVEVVLRLDGRSIPTGRIKFGAIVGDGTRIGANAVIAPGAVLPAGTVVARLELVDQSPG